MKKFVYLISIFAVLFMTACEPEENSIDLITIDILEGEWVTVSYNGIDKQNVSCEDMEHYFAFPTFDFDVSNNWVTLCDPCYAEIEGGNGCTSDVVFFYEEENNIISFSDKSDPTYQFHILEYDPVTQKMKLELIGVRPNFNVPQNGIYSLERPQ